jgi:hypothetical protein
LRQRYHLTLTRSLYFQNLDSNAGVLSRLLDEAEAQESLSALLGYFCLWRFAGPEGWTAEELDAGMDVYRDRYAEISVQCEAGAALRRLRTLGLVEEENGRARAVSLPAAVASLSAVRERYLNPDESDGGGQPAVRSRVDTPVGRGELRGLH